MIPHEVHPNCTVLYHVGTIRLYRIRRKGGEDMVGKRIKEYLIANGIKQSFIAEQVGITKSKMSDICNKDRIIDCVTYYKICKALNVPMETFITVE